MFIAFAGEEIGLSGSQTYAAMAKQKGMRIEAVLNNDIIGSDVAGNGRSSPMAPCACSRRLRRTRLRASPGRYPKQMAERYVPSMQVEMVFRGDRFLRGGDHTPFLNQGYAAVRLTTPARTTIINTPRPTPSRIHPFPTRRASSA